MPDKSKVSLKSIPTGIDDEVEFSFFDEDTQENIGKITYDLHKVSKKAKINYTYLIPERRREGILKSLLDEILCNIQCSGMKKVELHTITEDATKAWERLGFETIGTETDISGTAFTYMEKKLQEKCDCSK
ncbi:MAG: GNAT family N-acetyltransferase [Solirubrobacteraceae bacterium]|nr:GNAT family N-acetyltransferase [Solirubrobacteraceae bacterium]